MNARRKPVPFRPPEDELSISGWHIVRVPGSSRELAVRWHPGVGAWRDAKGRRWTAENAAESGWSYVGRAS